MNLTRSESRNTLGPSFKLQFDGALNHLPSLEDERKTINDQVKRMITTSMFRFTFLDRFFMLYFDIFLN